MTSMTTEEMIDTKELRRLAETAKLDYANLRRETATGEDHAAISNFRCAVDQDLILALLDELDAARAALRCYARWHGGESLYPEHATAITAAREAGE